MRKALSSRKKTTRVSDIDAYLASLPRNVRLGLQKLRTTIRTAVPDAEEGFSYGMPAFRLGGRPLIGFAAAQNHSSLYPMSAAVIRALASDLKTYETSKGAVRFPHDRPPPARLVRKLLKARMAELESRRT